MVDPAPSSVPVLRCAEHPGVETVLRCGKCDRPICPRCLVQTPVGARCRQCAQLRRSPVYSVSPAQYARGLGAGMGLALAVGAGWAFLGAFIGGFFVWLLAALAGYLIGEGVSRAVNRKRGRWLEVIAGISGYLAFAASLAMPSLLLATTVGAFSPGQIGATFLAAMLLPLRNLLLLIPAAIAVVLAVSRVR
ncbi:MAG: B-box zinc finger protein [Chloroflexi bacterium]|nr:B-box zinc finger protein [Chloroflexota bacterium]